jgi:hypothetical protein
VNALRVVGEGSGGDEGPLGGLKALFKRILDANVLRFCNLFLCVYFLKRKIIFLAKISFEKQGMIIKFIILFCLYTFWLKSVFYIYFEIYQNST